VRNSEGKGSAVLIGSFPSLAYYHEHDTNIKRFFLSLAQAAGVSPEVEVSGAGTSQVEVRRLVGEGEQLVLVFNHAGSPVDLMFDIRLPWTVREARELENDRPVDFQNLRGRTIFHRRLAEGEIWVFSIRGS
jgi:hypothetical protein